MSDPSSESAGKKLEEVVVEKTGALVPEDSIKTAGDRMRAADANSWPVVEGRKLVGTIDQANPDRESSGHGHDPGTTRVADSMRRDPFYCYEDQCANEAQRIMQEHNLNHLPVVDRDMRIVGILSLSDVAPPAGPAAAEPALPEA